MRAAIAVVALALLAGCGGGAETEALQQTVAPTLASYTGPVAESDDVQDFQIELWENIRDASRCGGCHTADGQAPRFARSDDVNLAFAAANTVVDLANPSNSRMVTFVAEGHNCWLDSTQACVDLLTTWISAWAGDGEDGGRKIALQPPESRDVGESLAYPEDPMLFAATVYPLLATYCADCHASGASPAISPFFADGDLLTAYEAVRPVLNLSLPELSRAVLRLREDFHNCWSDCADDAAAMESAVAAFASEIPSVGVDPDLLVSKALRLPDGIVAAGGDRIEGDQIALWEFKAGSGEVAFDTSGVDPAADLRLSGDFAWVGGFGVRFGGGRAQADTATSRKLHRLLTGTGEYSLELWVVPGDVNQDDAPIAAYTGGGDRRNFALTQQMSSYELANRSGATDAAGEPVLTTVADDRVLQATLQHVVMSFDPVAGRSLHVNGERIDLVDETPGGSLASWDDTFAFVLGNDVTGDAPWSGVLRFVALHDRVLDDDAVATNFAAGVGERFFMLFDVSEHLLVPGSYVLFEVSRFDDFSYLFTQPRLINLNGDTAVAGLDIEDLRIGINGVEATVGQSFRSLRATTTTDALEGTGQLLATGGAIVPVELGPEQDEFFLSFGVLGDARGVTVAAQAPPEPAPAPPQAQARVGLRTFDRIDATMSAVTGVPRTTPTVRETFELVREQLPGRDRLETFVSAQQIGITQLAIAYCDALVEDPARRAAFFGAFDFTAAPAVALDAAGRATLYDALLRRFIGTDLADQPDDASLRSELDALVDRLLASGGSDAARTRAVAKGACSAVLAGAPVTVI